MFRLNGSTAFAFVVLSATWGHCDGGSDVAAPAGTVDVDALVLTPADVPADGASLVIATARVTLDSSRAPVTVTLTSTTGVFPAAAAAAISGIADNTHHVTATLKVGRDTGMFIVRAVGGMNAMEQSLHLAYAYPQQLLVSAAALTVAAKSTITISASAIRIPGLVTRATPITFVLKRIDSSGNPPPGSIDGPVATDSLGNATIHFTSAAVATLDSVWLIAFTPRSKTPGDTVSNQIKLYITP